MTDSFNTRTTLQSGAQSYQIRSLAALGADKVARLPYSLKILLENLLRFEDGSNVTRADIEALLPLGGNPDEINPLAPAELVIDHSVQVDSYGTAHSLADNNRIEFERNGERYAFLRWGQSAFRNFKVVPPNTGIVHQVNLEFLGRVVFEQSLGTTRQAYPDTLVGTDSHTT